MSDLRVLDETRAAAVRAVCELIVPGCARVGAEVYVDALLARMPEARPATTRWRPSTSWPDRPSTGARRWPSTRSPPPSSWCARWPARPSTRISSRPGAAGPGAWEEIDFAPPLATRLNKDWSYLGVE